MSNSAGDHHATRHTTLPQVGALCFIIARSRMFNAAGATVSLALTRLTARNSQRRDHVRPAETRVVRLSPGQVRRTAWLGTFQVESIPSVRSRD